MSNTTKRKGRNYNSNNDNSNKDNSNNDNINVNSGNETDTTYNTGNLMQKYVEEETPTIAEERMAAVRMAANNAYKQFNKEQGLIRKLKRQRIGGKLIKSKKKLTIKKKQKGTTKKKQKGKTNKKK